MVLAVLPESQYSSEPHAIPVTPALFLPTPSRRRLRTFFRQLARTGRLLTSAARPWHPTAPAEPVYSPMPTIRKGTCCSSFCRSTPRPALLAMIRKTRRSPTGVRQPSPIPRQKNKQYRPGASVIMSFHKTRVAVTARLTGTSDLVDQTGSHWPVGGGEGAGLKIARAIAILPTAVLSSPATAQISEPQEPGTGVIGFEAGLTF